MLCVSHEGLPPKDLYSEVYRFRLGVYGGAAMDFNSIMAVIIGMILLYVVVKTELRRRNTEVRYVEREYPVVRETVFVREPPREELYSQFGSYRGPSRNSMNEYNKRMKHITRGKWL